MGKSPFIKCFVLHFNNLYKIYIPGVYSKNSHLFAVTLLKINDVEMLPKKY